MATNWNDYRKATEIETTENAEGVCDKTAPLFLEMLEQPFYSRKELGGEMSKMLQAVLNDKHGFNSKSHSATARHVTAMNAVLSAIVARGNFKLNGMTYTVAAFVERASDAPATAPASPASGGNTQRPARA